MKTQKHNRQIILSETCLLMSFHYSKAFTFTILMTGLLAISGLMSACEKTTDYKNPQVQALSAVTHKDANTTSAASSSAIVSNQHFEFNTPYENTNSCNGQLLTLNEHDKIDIHSVINDNRNNMQFHAVLQYDGTDEQGNTYHGNLIVNQIENQPLENGAYTFYIVVKLDMIGNGSAPNFIAKTTFKITVTPNGDTSVEKASDTLECKN